MTALAALAVAGCGDEEPTELEQREAIAMVINEVREALLAGEGETVCANLTEQGQRLMVQIGKRERRIGGETCEEVVTSIAGEFSEKQRADSIGESDYTAGDVDVDPTDDEGFNGVTDEVPEGGVPASVEVRCKNDAANSYFVVREGNEWKLTVPFCSGR